MPSYADGPACLWYPNRRWYLDNRRAADHAVQNGGTFLFGSWPQRQMDAASWEREKQGALDRRINERGGLWDTGRKRSPEYQVDLARDARDIQAHFQARIRIYQLRTPELRRRFAGILADPRE